MPHPKKSSLSSEIINSIETINELITTDASGRGMKSLVVPGDLLAAAELLARLTTNHAAAATTATNENTNENGDDENDDDNTPQPQPPQPPHPHHVIILTGFPCNISHSPPTETDGLASVALARACVQLGYKATLVTEVCNEVVFRAAVNTTNTNTKNNNNTTKKSPNNNNFFTKSTNNGGDDGSIPIGNNNNRDAAIISIGESDDDDKQNNETVSTSKKQQEEIEMIEETTEETTIDYSSINLQFYPEHPHFTSHHRSHLHALANSASLVIACERAGPAADGNCYTMRGINMNEQGLLAPLHEIVEVARNQYEKSSDNGQKNENGQGNNGPKNGSSSSNNLGESDNHHHHHYKVNFIAIGAGGNELGMGKVITLPNRMHIKHIPRSAFAVMAADCLIAASVSNWGAYALIAAAALVRYHDEEECASGNNASVGTTGEEGGRRKRRSRQEWIDACLPSEHSETQLLHRCLDVGCRDGVSERIEASIDGMPLETSMECLRNIRNVALGATTTTDVG